jgi:hypothetical protein
LSRYASAGAVYRELIQNSNDAEADTAEIHFTTKGSEKGIVTQVIYKNNGLSFRPQDWSRLKKIAEGNPNPEKVGAFGVGAYTMFSICEEPLVVSGDMALAFFWKGDSLWTKTAKSNNTDKQWTSFVLPSRDSYPLPSMAEFGEFLTASLTFTKCLKFIRVLVDEKETLSIIKTLVQEPRNVSTPKQSAWWKTNDAVTKTPKGLFSLGQNSIQEFVYRITVMLDGSVASLDARYISGTAKTMIPADIIHRMERVTKKKPPSELSVQLFLNAQRVTKRPTNAAERITQSFSPQPGKGRIFIGFRTSQTTGLAAHVAAPFIPTVEREAMDLQDPTLRTFNTELLEFSGILMRLVLEDTMYNVIDPEWKKNAPQREKLERELLQSVKSDNKDTQLPVEPSTTEDVAEEITSDAGSTFGRMAGFARFMKQYVIRINHVSGVAKCSLV